MMSRLRAWKHWRWVREVALVIAIVLGVRAYQQRNMPSGPAPALHGLALDGARVSLEEYRGKPVLVHFWATWCGVCSAEQGNIDALAGDLPVLSIASQSGSADEVQAYVRAHGIKPRVIVDEPSVLARRFGVSAYPTSFVLDAEGRIRHVEVGYTTEAGLRLRMWLASRF